MNKKSTYLASKPRYEILDGLRGVAAIFVVIFHLFETYSPDVVQQIVNHGYLAVDFFFVLSGFVIGYAYDERLASDKMSVKDFLKRRLVRLHPLVCFGALIGFLLFYFGGGPEFEMMADTKWYQLLLLLVIAFTMIPVSKGMDVRGWSETYPLNGATWTLMLEYIANILYVFIIRHLGKVALGICVALFAILTLTLTFNLDPFNVFPEYGNYAAYTVIGGWGIDPAQLYIGFTRLLYPFFMGLLLSRMGKFITVKGGFWWCALIIALCQAMPRIGGANPENFWMNGLYESVVILAVFPMVVAMGAGSRVTGQKSQKFCKFLGDISYPVYITHYPLIYVQMGWAHTHQDATIDQHIMVAISIFCLAIALAWASLKLYDEPVREWLKKKIFS
ncbi:MAG: acyltransferase [Bacteroidales bacterium]|nr:acyltransferase [Bacteroidales bacterium]